MKVKRLDESKAFIPITITLGTEKEALALTRLCYTNTEFIIKMMEEENVKYDFLHYSKENISDIASVAADLYSGLVNAGMEPKNEEE